MEAFLDGIIAFPTVIYTIPFALSIVYWLFVVVGAVDLDLFESANAADGALEGIAEGAADGALEGIAEGAADGALDGIAEGAVEGVEGAVHGVEGSVHGVEGAAHGATDGGLEATSESVSLFASVLRLGKVPITVSFSLLFFFAFAFSSLGMEVVKPLVPDGVLGWLVRTLMGAGAMVGSASLTTVLLRPLEKVFTGAEGTSASDIVGSTATLTTSRANERMGQAAVRHSDGELVFQVRCKSPNDLKKGDELLLIAYDRKKNLFHAQPYKALLEEVEDPDIERRLRALRQNNTNKNTD